MGDTRGNAGVAKRKKVQAKDKLVIAPGTLVMDGRTGKAKMVR